MLDGAALSGQVGEVGSLAGSDGICSSATAAGATDEGNGMATARAQQPEATA